MNRQPHVYHRRVADEEWINVVDGYRDELAFIYAEEPADLYLEAYRRPEARWTHGRAFGEALEVRWSRQRDGTVELLMLTERDIDAEQWEPVAVAEDDGASLTVDAVEESSVLLAGTHRRRLKSAHRKSGEETPHQWIETRIPRPLVYPLPEKPHPERWAQVKVLVYRAQGRPVLMRMVDMEATDDVTTLSASAETV